MKTTITKKIVGLALSVFSMAAMAQCPSITSLGITYGSNGAATVTPVMTGTVNAFLTNYYWQVTPNATQTSGSSSQQGTFQFPANGIYTVCVNYSDSSNGCWSNQYCTTVNISNMSASSCNATFTSYTDSSCVTHFMNSSTGTNLTYDWYINGVNYTSVNPAVGLPNGGYSVYMSTYSSGIFCDSTYQYVTVSCGGTGTTTPCNAAFSFYTDTNCVTYFMNYPNSNSYSMWDIDGMTYSYTPSVNLANGSHHITQIMYDQNGFICDSAHQFISVYCPSSSTVTPSCNAGFVYYTDSSCVTYFYNTSVTNNGFVIWNVDGITYSVTPSINLANGAHSVYQTVYDQNGFVCDTAYQSIYISCSNSGTTTPTGCQANSQFYVFPDSLNTGNYFAYNFSSGTGNISYLWNFGDGTSSTQQYPFHQYAVPGQYVICLTVNATYTSAFGGTTTCSDSYCDSSSVQRIAAGFLMSQVNVVPQAVTGIKQIENNTALKAFPNPMADELTIEAINTDNSKLTYILIDALGRSVLTGELINSKATINTGNLEKGFYSLSITNEKGSSLKTIKLVK